MINIKIGTRPGAPAAPGVLQLVATRASEELKFELSVSPSHVAVGGPGTVAVIEFSEDGVSEADTGDTAAAVVCWVIQQIRGQKIQHLAVRTPPWLGLSMETRPWLVFPRAEWAESVAEGPSVEVAADFELPDLTTAN